MNEPGIRRQSRRDAGCALTRPRNGGSVGQEPLFRVSVSPSYTPGARASVSRFSMSAQRSIVICGSAFAGLALALALRQGLGADIGVIVADPALAARPSRDPRATAIVAACRRLVDALVQRAEAEGIDLRATAVTTYDSRSAGIDVTLADGSLIEASLLVAADGARSRLRERGGIATHGWEYDQSGIVGTVGHERDHQGRAEEHFLPSGPFAILPLSG